jgi:hypothetical protein
MQEEQKSKPKKVSKKKPAIIFAALLLIAAAFFLIFNGKNNNPLPESIIKQSNFAVYYPTSLPKGYVLDKNSAAYDNQILFFSISNGDRKISISEQAPPKNPPDFDVIQKGNTSFKKLDVTGGQAIYGVSQQTPAAILVTNTTLINVSGSNNVPLDNVSKLIQSMSPQ